MIKDRLYQSIRFIKARLFKAYKTSSEKISDVTVESSKETVINIAESALDSASSAINSATEIVTKPISDMKYISKQNDKIKKIIVNANEKIEPARIRVNKTLECFGEVKINIIGTTLAEFSSLMGTIKNLPYEHNEIKDSKNAFSFTEQSLDDLNVASISAAGLIKNGAVASAGGALSASAVYGTVALLGSASTGTAIGTLSGVAATNATLAWLGGGALAVGGGGIAFGTMVLGGLALVPAISYFIWKGSFNFSDKKEKIDENYSEALEYSQSVDEAIIKFESLERFIESATSVIERHNVACIQCNKQTINIISNKGKNFNKYTDEQKKLIEKQSNYIEGLLNLINTPLMDESGTLNNEAVNVMKYANDFLSDRGEIEFIDFKRERTSVLLWLLLILILIAVTSVSYAGQNESFSKSKKQLRKIYQNNQTTFYCGCSYNYKDKKDMIDETSCGYKPRLPYFKSGKPNIRSKRIEWEHVVPAENFGRQFTCWRNGDSSCVTSKGKSYKGRRCCTKVNKKYRVMQADMHNLVPTVGELNADRSNYRFDFELPNATQYGACEFEVIFKERRARVKQDIRGNIARSYLYMNDQHGMTLSKQEIKKYKAWNKEDPIDAWEQARNLKILKIQGNLNTFIAP